MSTNNSPTTLLFDPGTDPVSVREYQLAIGARVAGSRKGSGKDLAFLRLHIASWATGAPPEIVYALSTALTTIASNVLKEKP